MENLRGAAFMVFAMLCFAIEDALIKFLARDMPVGQVLVVIAFGGLVGFLGFAKLRRQPLWQRDYLNPKVLLRSGCDATGTVLFATALTLIPLTTASAVIQATPLVVALGAALFLGQPIGWRRWIAITVGFIGVLIIIRPGLEGFTPATLLAVAGMLALASRDLLTRSLSVSLSGAQLATHTFAVVVPASAALMVFQGQKPVMPDMAGVLLLGAAVVIGMIAYLAIVTATRHGNAGIISSFRYSRMVFALAIGYIVFAERPDLLTMLGVTIIVTSGIYTLVREARLHRASLTPKPALQRR